MKRADTVGEELLKIFMSLLLTRYGYGILKIPHKGMRGTWRLAIGAQVTGKSIATQKRQVNLMINISEKARQKFKQALEQRKISANARLRVNFGGIG